MKQVGAPIVVTVTKDGTTEIDGKNLSRDKLLFEIKNQLKNKERPVVVAADEKTQYGKVIEVMDLLKQANVDKVGLLFKPAP